MTRETIYSMDSAINKKILILLFVVICVVSAAKPEVIIFKGSNGSLSKSVQRYLSANAKVTTKGVATSSTVASLVQSKPAAIISLDNTSSRTLKRNNTGGIPVIIATDAKQFGSLNSVGATFASQFYVDSVLALAYNDAGVSSVTFLYVAKDRGAISRTASRCRARGLTVKHHVIADETPEVIKSTLQTLKASNSLVYVVRNKALLNSFKNQSNLVTQMAANVKAIVTTSSSISSFFRKKAHIYSIQEDTPTLSALIAEATARAINSGHSDKGRSKLLKGAKLFHYVKGSGKTISISSTESKKLQARANSAVARIRQLPDLAEEKVVTTTTTAEDKKIDSLTLAAAAMKVPEKKVVDSTLIKAAAKQEAEKKSTKKWLKPKPKYDTTYVTVTEEATNIFSTIAPKLTLIGVAKKGDTFELLGKKDEYLRIKAWGRRGYIHENSIVVKEVPKPEVVVEKEPELSDKEKIRAIVKEYFVVISIGLSLALILFVALIIRFIKKRIERKRLLYSRSALLLSKKAKKIIISDKTGETSTLKAFLKQLDIHLTPVTSLHSFQERMIKHMPDLIIVDWTMEHTVASVIKDQLSKYRLSSATTLIFFNVPDKDRLFLSDGFGQATVYLHDEFPSVEKTELILGEEKSTPIANIKKQDSHLAGVLGNSHLEDIIQLLGTSQKSGCLVVEDEDPYAVIFFMNGIIVDAITREGTPGRAAIFNALQMTEGSFYFMLNRQANEQTMQLSTMQLLMEWSQYQDMQRSPQATPAPDYKPLDSESAE